MIDGEQYIAINAGWGGSPVMNLNRNGPFRTATAKLLVFKLGATGVTLPPMPPPNACRARRRCARPRRSDQRPRALRADLPALPRRERRRRGQGLALHDAAGPRAFDDIVLKGISQNAAWRASPTCSRPRTSRRSTLPDRARQRGLRRRVGGR
jgi:quinohemoprotein ethanol dehydrogenase